MPSSRPGWTSTLPGADVVKKRGFFKAFLNHDRWIDWAEVFDSWRVVPRIFLFLTFSWVVYVTEKLIGWYVHLPHIERGPEASGFAAVVQVGLLGFLKMVFSDYADKGRDWNQRPTSPTPPSTPSPPGLTP
jgi:hypothetical protein